MTVVVGWEPILKALRDRIEDQLPGDLATAAAAYPDNVAVPAPAVVKLNADETNNAFPAVYIVPGDDLLPENQSGGWVTSLAAVTVAAEVEAPDADSVALLALRYEAALRSCVLRNPPPAPIHHVLWVSTLRSDVFQLGAGAVYRAWVEIQLQCKIFEEFL